MRHLAKHVAAAEQLELIISSVGCRVRSGFKHQKGDRVLDVFPVELIGRETFRVHAGQKRNVSCPRSGTLRMPHCDRDAGTKDGAQTNFRIAEVEFSGVQKNINNSVMTMVMN